LAGGVFPLSCPNSRLHSKLSPPRCSSSLWPFLLKGGQLILSFVRFSGRERERRKVVDQKARENFFFFFTIKSSQSSKRIIHGGVRGGLGVSPSCLFEMTPVERGGFSTVGFSKKPSFFLLFSFFLKRVTVTSHNHRLFIFISSRLEMTLSEMDSEKKIGF
jgi:hypothetical protein